MEIRYDYCYKIIVIGDAQVGKTSLVSRFSDNTFNTLTMPTIGVDFRIKHVPVYDTSSSSSSASSSPNISSTFPKIIKLQIWDTAGQERFRSITSSYFRGAHGIIVVFDITNYSSFLSVGKWIQDALDEQRIHNQRLYEPGASSITPKIIVVGHKAELGYKRVVSIEQAREEANKWNASYLEVSSQKPAFASSPDEVFIDLANNIYKSSKTNSSADKLVSEEKGYKKICCSIQ